MEEILVCVWHDCMKCITKGLENYVRWVYRDKSVTLISKAGVEDANVLIASCSSFEPTQEFKALSDILEKKRWYVALKPCEMGPKEHFRNSEIYKWLLNNKKAVHIAENYILDLNRKVNESKNKPRLDT